VISGPNPLAADSKLRSLTLLLVDRDPARAELLTAALERAPEAGVGRWESLAPLPARVTRWSGLGTKTPDDLDGVVVTLGPDEDPRAAIQQLGELAQRRPVVLVGGQVGRNGVRRYLKNHVLLYVPVEELGVSEPLDTFADRIRLALERRRLRRELDQARDLNAHLADRDPLTGLGNRESFRRRLDSLFERAQETNAPFGLLILDIDRFREINDTLGPSAGDELLREVARRLRACLRTDDLLARRGGDEFTVLLDDVRGAKDAVRVARKVLKVLAEPYSCCASGGVSLYPRDGADAETLIKHADTAMYRAKEHGRNGFEVFREEMGAQVRERVELETGLRRAIAERELVLHFQPIVELETGRVTAFEALVRWQHLEQGLVYPDQFIGLAEETGLILPLGELVLETACRTAVEWRAAGLPAVRMSVNLSAHQFRQRDLVERVGHVLDDTGLDPRCLGLELTESTVIHDPDHAETVLHQLRELGVSVSIDDFGTGFSSLSHLKRFSVDRLKIDRSFIRTLRVDPKDAAITRAVIGLAHSLGMRAVAEGVETLGQLAYLRSPGCDEIQGYLFSPPVPEDEARDLQLPERVSAYRDLVLVGSRGGG
jgi:diguanylate cyclase (GGDEF)-like protein